MRRYSDRFLEEMYNSPDKEKTTEELIEESNGHLSRIEHLLEGVTEECLIRRLEEQIMKQLREKYVLLPKESWSIGSINGITGDNGNELVMPLAYKGNVYE